MPEIIKSPAIRGYIDWLGHIEYRLVGKMLRNVYGSRYKKYG